MHKGLCTSFHSTFDHICVGHLSLLSDLLWNFPCSNLYIWGLDFLSPGFPVGSANGSLERFKVGGGRKLRCLSFPLPAQGGILGSAISPGSLQLHQANLSSVLPAGSLCRALSSASSPSSGSLCGPSGLRAGATSSHCHSLGCCTLSSLASQFYHHLGNNTSFLY